MSEALYLSNRANPLSGVRKYGFLVRLTRFCDVSRAKRLRTNNKGTVDTAAQITAWYYGSVYSGVYFVGNALWHVPYGVVWPPEANRWVGDEGT